MRIMFCAAKRAPSVKVKTINKSAFAKSGSDSYITGTLELSVPESEKVYILESDYGLIWNPIDEPYVCAVASPKKESKLKGLKSFIVYQLTPSVSAVIFIDTIRLIGNLINVRIYRSIISKYLDDTNISIGCMKD